MAVHRGLKVELPAARGVPEQGERVIVTLAADGTLSLNRRPLALEDLVRGVTLLWRETGTPVLISTDRAAPLGVGIELLGRLKEGGVERVTFQVSGKP